MEPSYLDDPAFTVSVALAAGVIGQALAHHIRVPGIVVFLLAGVLLGPDGFGVVRPETMGHGLEMLVGLAVAVILFEGGLNLNIGRLRREAKTIRRLITVGAIVTAAGGAVLARLLMGWTWTVAILFGTLVIVTGPTVITPLLRRIRVKASVQTVLEAEGVLIDPVGAIVAVVALEFVLEGGGTEAAFGLLGIPSRLIVGALIGVIGGFFIGWVLRYESLVPDGLSNIFTLALVLVLFEISDAVLSESGIMTAAVAGLVVGNMRTRVQRDLLEFKEQLTVMLVAMLFVLLAADVRLAEVAALGAPAVLTILGLMFIVRPINVWVSSAGSALTANERLFMCWLSPRGIVAAAVASLFAQLLVEAGFEGGPELRAMVFMVIAATVVVQGLTGGWVAKLLRVNRPTDHGFVIVGARPVSRALASVLREGGRDVVLIDSNASEARRAESEGFTVIFGSADEERVLMRSDVEGRHGFISLTPNADTNLLICNQVREISRRPSTYVALARGGAGARARRVHHHGHAVLFGGAIEMGQWNHRLEQGGATVVWWALQGPPREPWGSGKLGPDLKAGHHLIPLAFERNRRLDPVSDAVTFRPGDRVALLMTEDRPPELEARLREAGWSRAVVQEAPAEPVAT